MPIYEYQCRRCEHRFELIQKFSDKPRKRCPECSGTVDRLISPPAIRFKGSGWYVTDYANKKSNEEDKKSNEEDKKSNKEDKRETASKNKETERKKAKEKKE
ncbi:MAG: zinc ribbon domain-containing protein [Acidobacteriota bacterium]|jgi:putative FmdB family regulatory protein|nr:transcriptional regulator [Acidobacteriota bacterium]MED5559587.1 zinc ribbon domain-containing protein [Acidobacteriota bacterium]|tara:strand:+ start:3756 stop:4061 length:306 start_codon:yes stop_codon:yes gene_type:complete